MRIYLDSKDIIELLEKSDPCSVREFDSFLRDGSHQLVLSLVTIIEISRPLSYKNAKTNVMRLLNQIEELPHIFIHSSTITRLELEQAVRAFACGNGYRDILPPFVDRFDKTLDLPTRQYINYPLAKIVWDLSNNVDIGDLDKYGKKLRDVFKADRAENPKPSLEKVFANAVEKNIKRFQLGVPTAKVVPFANWIFANPNRCPSERVCFELQHKLLRNVTDIPADSDMGDFVNIEALPYVDIMTLDRRMQGYLCQVSKDIAIEYNKKTFGNVKEVLKNVSHI